MSWQDNRRRKRWWYQRYAWLAEDIERVLSQPNANAAELMLLVHRFMERGRHYGSNFKATSAYKSLLLCAHDRHMNEVGLHTHLPAPSHTAPVRMVGGDQAVPHSLSDLLDGLPSRHIRGEDPESPF